MHDLQRKIQGLLDQAVATDRETGVQVAAYFQGELVVDAFAGLADSGIGTAMTGDTLFPIFSTTKGMMVTIVHRLAERGVLSYDTPIAHFWPEFAAHGKGNITIRHALKHAAGLPFLPVGTGPREICDWNFMCAAIADLTPVSSPGERFEYHALTFGWIVGETARRATGRSFADLWRDELCAPLGTEATMFCGVPAALDLPIAVLEDATMPSELPVEGAPEAIPYWMWPPGVWMNQDDARRSCNPASTGIADARSIARHYAALLPGGVDGIELLSPERVQLACAPDATNPEAAYCALGYSVFLPTGWNDSPVFGHGGYGGSLGFADIQSGWAFGFTKNRFDGTTLTPEILAALKG